MNHASAAAGSGTSIGTAAASITAKRSFSDATAHAFAGISPFTSAIQVGYQPSSSSAIASGSSNAPAETAVATPARR